MVDVQSNGLQATEPVMHVSMPGTMTPPASGTMGAEIATAWKAC